MPPDSATFLHSAHAMMRPVIRPMLAAAGAAALLLASVEPARAAVDSVQPLDVRGFRPSDGPTSGPGMYYQVVDDPDGPVLRASSRPGMETVTMAVEVPDAIRQKAQRLRWRWRARAFPAGGDECRPGKGDSAASVTVAFKRGLKWYILKYVWSSVGPLGATCESKRSMFLAKDTIILESGGAPGSWLVEVVDVRRAFIDHFAGGDPRADVPDLVGIAVMSDGDQTNSESGADWTGFELFY